MIRVWVRVRVRGKGWRHEGSPPSVQTLIMPRPPHAGRRLRVGGAGREAGGQQPNTGMEGGTLHTHTTHTRTHHMHTHTPHTHD